MNLKDKISSLFNAIFLRRYNTKLLQSIENIVKNMRPTEKAIFFFMTIILSVSGLSALYTIHQSFLIEIPAFGGQFTEGFIGSPRFVNPVIAISDTDKDIASLVFAGLLKQTVDGKYVDELSSSHSISEDGTVYEVEIKDNVYFHNGDKVTVDDVIFTINKVLDPVVKSPKRTNWEGVVLEKINDNKIRFTLKKPYAPFIETLTLGILPKSIWEKVSSEEFPFSELNIKPIGAGPYKIESTKKNSAGIPTSISLSAYKKYTLGKPNIKSINLKFFLNEKDLTEAYKNEEISSLVNTNTQVSDENIDSIISQQTPRIFAIFMNQNTAPIFLNKEVRIALDLATPKKEIINEVLNGFGEILDGPHPSDIQEPSTESLSTEQRIEMAKNILDKAGWKIDPEDQVLKKEIKKEKIKLAFSISTSDTPYLIKTAEILKNTWEKIGVKVDIKIFEVSDLNQNIIRSRKYDALLFGQIVNSESDLYSFWHSSQRLDPGLNVASYTNITADKILENLKTETNQEKISEMKNNLRGEIKNDLPAIFLFVPKFIYIPDSKVKNINLKQISASEERFISIKDWFIETEKVWQFWKNFR